LFGILFVDNGETQIPKGFGHIIGVIDGISKGERFVGRIADDKSRPPFLREQRQVREQEYHG